jgi:hypothetical protein
MKILFILILIVFFCSCYSPYEHLVDWCANCNKKHCCNKLGEDACVRSCDQACGIQIKC